MDSQEWSALYGDADDDLFEPAASRGPEPSSNSVSRRERSLSELPEGPDAGTPQPAAAAAAVAATLIHPATAALPAAHRSVGPELSSQSDPHADSTAMPPHGAFTAAACNTAAAVQQQQTVSETSPMDDAQRADAMLAALMGEIEDQRRMSLSVLVVDD